MGIWNLLWNWGKRLDSPGSPVPPPHAPAAGKKAAKRRRSTVKAAASHDASRRCHFEQMEDRQMMSANPIHLGVTYMGQDNSTAPQPETFQVKFEGGQTGTELSEIVIDGDHTPQGFTFGDILFNTVDGGIGVGPASAFHVVSQTGGGAVTAHVVDGTSKLTLDFTGFHAGDKLVFQIGVNIVHGLNPAETDVSKINLGLSNTVYGYDIEGSTLTATLKESHSYDVTGSSQFVNNYENLFASTGLPETLTNPDGLQPYHSIHADCNCSCNFVAGALVQLQQTPLPDTLAGTVYLDHNLNLNQDAPDPGISGVTLTLFRKDGSSYTPTGFTTTTDKDGHYQFGPELKLQPGIYQVRETQPAGYYSVGAKPGDVSGTPTGAAVTGDPDVLTEINIPLGGLHGVHYDFAEYLPSTISGRVQITDRFGNCSADGVVTAPLPDVAVYLQDSQGQTLQQTKTDAQGNYQFTNLKPGTYTVVEITPTGYIEGDADVGTIDGQTVGATLGTHTITGIALATGKDGVKYDFCEHLPGMISGYVYGDVNNNGLRETGEPPISGALVTLLDAAGKQVGQTTTDQQGFYKFTGLTSQVYCIVETQPVGWLDGLDAAGTIGGVTVGSADNPGDKIRNINLLWGDSGIQYNFGELQPGSIAGKVFVDPNQNCIYTPGDRLLSGVTIELRDSSGAVIRSTKTANDGTYSFGNLPPGNYTVHELEPAGFIHEGQMAGSGGGDDSQANFISAVSIPYGADLTEYDFCELEPVSIAGVVFVDNYHDCILRPDDPLLAGVSIHLVDSSGVIVASTTTDASGAYHFDHLHPDTYTVREDQPANYFHGGQMAGSQGGDDSQPNVIDSVQLLSGINATDYNFCEVPQATLSGYVFHDGPPIVTTDGAVPDDLTGIRDGVLTPDDRRLAGIVLELRYTLSGDQVQGSELLPGAYPPGPVVAVTDANGFYEFHGLRQGNYTVIEQQPTSYTPGINTAGTTHGLALNRHTAVSPFIVQTFADQGIPLHLNAILQIPLRAGQNSQFNNFSAVDAVTIFIPPTPPPATPPIAPAPPIVGVSPLAPLKPEIGLPNPPVEPAPFGHGPGYTWHLSVVNAGLPRTTARSTRTSGVAMRSVLFVDRAKWSAEQLRDGIWKITQGREAGQETLVFGAPGAIPVVGDWDGDGQDQIGVYYHGEWLLDLNGNGRWDESDLWAKLGSETDLPVVGDWDGDGKDDIGIYGPEWLKDPRHLAHEPGLPDPQNELLPRKRPKNVPPDVQQATEGERYLRRTMTGKERADLIDHVFRFGTPTDIPIAGDWNGDGITTIGIFRGGHWLFDKDGDGRQTPGDETAEFGAKGDLPVVGDFNGDGIDEIGVYRAGRWIIDTNGNRQIDPDDKSFELGAAGDLPVVGDFNGDGVDEPGVYQPGAAAEMTARKNQAD